MAVVTTLLFASMASAYWTDDSALKETTEQQKWVPSPRFTLDLDLPKGERWNDIAAHYKDKAPAMINYLKENLPTWALPIVKLIGKDIEPYFKDYGEEIVGLAKVLDVAVGDLVALNLVYQIEHVGINCSEWNNTGPVGDDDAVDPSWKKGCTNKTKLAVDGPGLCTSVLAEDSEGRIWHGRNLDWNLDPTLKVLMVDIDYQREGKTVFIGTTLVGFVGILNGVRPGAWTYSMDAREKGGNVELNLLEALTHHARTPSQHARFVMESADAVDFAAGRVVFCFFSCTSFPAKFYNSVLLMQRSNNWRRIQSSTMRTSLSVAQSRGKVR
jgi:N-acylethanolamine-hydrolysing acid amidase